MIDEAAIHAARAAVRAHWSLPPLDRRDVEERVAVRLQGHEGTEVRVLQHAVATTTATATRLFVAVPNGWRSRYVHELADVDRVLAELLPASRCAA